MPGFFQHVLAAALILDTKSTVSLPGIMCAEFKRCKFYVEFIHINMDVFSTIVLLEGKQPMCLFHFAEVAVEASTNDTWVSNYAFISVTNTLKVFIKKEKEKTQCCKNSLCHQELKIFYTIITFNVTEWALFYLLPYQSLSLAFFFYLLIQS